MKYWNYALFPYKNILEHSESWRNLEYILETVKNILEYQNNIRYEQWQSLDVQWLST